MKKLTIIRTAFGLVSGVLLLATSCGKSGKAVHREDWIGYVPSGPAETTSKYFELWNRKIRPDSMQLQGLVVVAGEYTRFFQNSGDVQWLDKAEKALHKALEIGQFDRASLHRAYARNRISVHRFDQALEHALKARENGRGPEETQALLFDVYMELGRFEEARAQLDLIRDEEDFGYLIREAKWQDHRGELSRAIYFMEQALRRIEGGTNVELKTWTYANLGDFYSHDGRFESAVNMYLKSLKINPYCAQAVKGLAWIAYSYDRNDALAMEILDGLSGYYQGPELWLLKSEVAGSLGRSDSARVYRERFDQQTQNRALSAMYATYRIDLKLEEPNTRAEALRWAKQEAGQRQTPEVYAQLAYAYLRNSDSLQALQIVEDYVRDRTYEPGSLLYMAEVYQATGRHREAGELKKELLEAQYELGPDMMKRVTAL